MSRQLVSWAVAHDGINCFQLLASLLTPRLFAAQYRRVNTIGFHVGVSLGVDLCGIETVLIDPGH